MEFALKLEPYPYDAAQAKRLLTEAGYPGGFDAGDLTPLPPFTTFGEALTNSLAAVGIRTRVREMERATFMEAWRGKKLSGVIATVSAAPGGNAATVSRASCSAPHRTRPAATRTSTTSTGSRARSATQEARGAAAPDPAPDAPARDVRPDLGAGDATRRGPRVEQPAIGLSPQLYFAAPYEEIRLKRP